VTPHPLRRLGADEIRRARELLAGNGLVGEHTRFAYLGLEEPPKAEVLAFRDGQVVDRRVRAILLDTASGGATDVVASLTRGTVDAAAELDTAREGQPPIMLEDLVAVDEIVKADPGWREAMARRGVTDLDLVRPCPLSAGSFGLQGEEGRRMLRVLSFVQHHPKDHPWAHPVDGLVAYVDLIERRVLHLIDAEVLPIPEEEGNFDDPAAVGPARTSLRPIQITQPEGPSFTLDGDEVAWEGWRLRVGFDAREGLTLHQLSVADRPVVSLMLGCDCLGEIRYLDAVLPDGDGQPREVPNAICLHEEDVGVAWKHNDVFTGSAETRRMRRLVISSFVAIGNYDYGFFWYLYLDGRIELEIKATGVVFTSAYVEGSRWATEVAPGLGAPYHRPGPPTRRSGGPGRWSTRPGPTGSASRSPTPSTPRPRRCSPPTPAPPSAAGPPSPPGTCGSPATTRPSGTPPATCPTSILGGPGCPPTSPPTATSTARTSSCGTPSG
jgi:primary-amine oxidase